MAEQYAELRAELAVVEAEVYKRGLGYLLGQADESTREGAFKRMKSLANHRQASPAVTAQQLLTLRRIQYQNEYDIR